MSPPIPSMSVPAAPVTGTGIGVPYAPRWVQQLGAAIDRLVPAGSPTPDSQTTSSGSPGRRQRVLGQLLG
jgi:hypothetical protein